MTGRPTIRDVALRAGVGVKTVSRVINREHNVSQTTRQRVLSAIEELHYRPNAAAQVLGRSLVSVIAFVCEDVNEPFAAMVASRIEESAAGRSRVITASSRGDRTRERELLESLIARRVDGIVLAPSRGDLSYLNRRRGGVPIVCIDRPATGFASDVAMSDNTAGMAVAVELLIARGHRRIAYFGDAARLLTQRERLAGYRQALRRHGVELDPVLVYQHSPDAARLSRQHHYLSQLPSPPTAVVSANSLTTLDLIHSGLPVDGGNFVAFDDFPLADVVLGGITRVVQDTPALGVAAADLLFRRIENDDSPPIVMRIPTRLIERPLAPPGQQLHWPEPRPLAD